MCNTGIYHVAVWSCCVHISIQSHFNVYSVQCVCHLGTKLHVVIYFCNIVRHCVKDLRENPVLQPLNDRADGVKVFIVSLYGSSQ